MPLFEYRCRACNQSFEAIVSSSRPAACPRCEGADLEKLLSVFAVGHAGGHGGSHAHAAPEFSPSGGGCGTCGDPRGPGACKLD